MLNWRSGSGHEEVVSTEAIQGGRVVREEENDEKKVLLFLGSSISVDVYSALLEY